MQVFRGNDGQVRSVPGPRSTLIVDRTIRDSTTVLGRITQTEAHTAHCAGSDHGHGASSSEGPGTSVTRGCSPRAAEMGPRAATCSESPGIVSLA